jgi:hypothetical protein
MNSVSALEDKCQVVGTPDFNTAKCVECMETADPLYKECLNTRLRRLHNFRPKTEAAIEATSSVSA